MIQSQFALLVEVVKHTILRDGVGELVLETRTITPDFELICAWHH